MAFTSHPLPARYGLKDERRLPPARERLAKHSGDGSRHRIKGAEKAGMKIVLSA